MIKINSFSDLKDHIYELRAVVLDLDDTLYPERDYVRSGFCAVAEALPLVHNAEDKLFSLFERGENAIDALLESEGIYSDELKDKCLSAYRNHSPMISLYECVPELICYLKSKGYLIGIITDGRPEGQRAKIEALDIGNLVDEIIITDELGGAEYRKPCKIAFELMRERLSALAGEEITFAEMCYVGDNTSKDFIAPDSLGMRSIWFDNPEGLYKSGF